MYAPDLIRELPGASWLQERRLDAAARAAGASLPTFEAEEWRYSPIDELALDAFSPALARPDAPVDAFAIGAAAATVVTADGFLHHVDVVDDAITILPVSTSEDGVELSAGTDVFGEANVAFAPDPIVISVPAGRTVADPVVITHHVVSASAAVFPHVVIDVGADAEVSVVEVFVSDDVDSMVVPVTSISVGDAARVRYQQVQDLGRTVWQLGTLEIDVGSQATFAGGIAAVGGSYARVRTDCRLNGRGASGDLFAVYFGNGDQTLDFRTFQDHVGRDTHSNLLFKGVVDDSSTSIYTGLIRVGKDAAGTNAFQTNRTIKLSDDAWAESVPNLEIENNDVRCSHASTVSPVDEQQRFYLESRGVPTDAAEQLIVQGFLHEVVSELPVAAANEQIESLVLRKAQR